MTVNPRGGCTSSGSRRSGLLREKGGGETGEGPGGASWHPGDAVELGRWGWQWW